MERWILKKINELNGNGEKEVEVLYYIGVVHVQERTKVALSTLMSHQHGRENSKCEKFKVKFKFNAM